MMDPKAQTDLAEIAKYDDILKSIFIDDLLYTSAKEGNYRLIKIIVDFMSKSAQTASQKELLKWYKFICAAFNSKEVSKTDDSAATPTDKQSKIYAELQAEFCNSTSFVHICSRIFFIAFANEPEKALEEMSNFINNGNMCEIDIWIDLAEYFEETKKYDQMQFCLEELILHQPRNPFLHFKLAEAMKGSKKPEFNFSDSKKILSSLLNAHELHSKVPSLTPQQLTQLFNSIRAESQLIVDNGSNGASKKYISLVKYCDKMIKQL